MLESYSTDRLLLKKLSRGDEDFIFNLLNSEGWIKFIGDRNIKTTEDAEAYIQKISDNPTTDYWTVSIKESGEKIGLVTLIRRDYLEHPDIGFAFLPGFGKKGYAEEAASALLNELIKEQDIKAVAAITVKDNINSIRLLEKLGLRFEKEIERDNEILLLYIASLDKLQIDVLVKNFFGIFNNNNRQPDWQQLNDLCLAETTIIKMNAQKGSVYNLDTFIEPRKKILSDGTLTAFEETEISESTTISGNIAQRFSRYQKSGYLNGNHFKEFGNKSFQFIKTEMGWRISSLVWEDDK